MHKVADVSKQSWPGSWAYSRTLEALGLKCHSASNTKSANLNFHCISTNRLRLVNPLAKRQDI